MFLYLVDIADVLIVMMNFNCSVDHTGSVVIAAKDNGFIAFLARAEDILDNKIDFAVRATRRNTLNKFAGSLPVSVGRNNLYGDCHGVTSCASEKI